MKNPCNVIPIITRLPTALTAKTQSKAVGPKATLLRHITEDNPHISKILGDVEALNKNWDNPFGRGDASETIVNDLIELSKSNNFKKHKPSDYAFDVSNSFKE